MKLKWSQYILSVNSADGKRVILHNSLSGNTVTIMAEIKAILDTAINNKSKENFLPSYIQNHLDRLTKLEILVPDNQDEKEKYQKFRKIAQENSNNTFSVVLVTTTSCQFSCSYCFEQGINRQELMNTKTADKVILWCQNYLDSHPNCTKWNLHIIGGEPLLNIKIIKYILPKINQIAKDKNIPLAIELTTNGTLLDINTLTFLNKYNLDTVNISIDGPKEIHDIRRKDKSKQSSFDKIFQNIRGGLKHKLFKKVYLSITTDKQNIDSLPKLFDYLVENNLQDKVILVFNMIYISTSEGLGKKIVGSHYSKFDLTETQKAQKYVWLCQEVQKRGLIIPKKWQIGPVCVAQNKNSVVIQPNGSLLKCPRGIGHPEFTFGNIISTKEPFDPHFNLPISLESCISQKCSLIPLCNGGCQLHGFFSNNDFSKPHCRKKFIEKVNKGLLQLNFS